ncbi:hypothetical protein [Baaleninema sp.]|uniref:hypothetical protein n=1 Tax=Baaleninema sp. TaxID=3101197 RepID=UPI003D07683D
MELPTTRCMLKSPSPPNLSPKPRPVSTTFSKSPNRDRTKERFLLYGAWTILVLSLVAMVGAGVSSIEGVPSEEASLESPIQP